MEAYRCIIELQDYLFFATTERGKTFETGAFIHNYALTYALIMAGIADFPNSGDYPAYYHEKQIPAYQEELQPFNEAGFYVTPAFPDSMRFRNTQFNTQKEGYDFGDKARSIAYPDWGFLRVICPQSTFVFYVLSGKEIGLRPQKYIRLGKFSCKAGLIWQKAGNVIISEGDFDFDGILNWQDLLQKPFLFNIMSGVLPSRLIQKSRFKGSACFKIEFNDSTVTLPVKMGYMADSDKTEKKIKRKTRKTETKGE